MLPIGNAVATVLKGGVAKAAAETQKPAKSIRRDEVVWADADRISGLR
jgi:hypothetical protein